VTHNTVEQFVGDPVGVFRGERDQAVSANSPYTRKVRVVAMETRLDCKMEIVDVAVSPVAPNADDEKHNPIGKIPAPSVKGMDLFDSPTKSSEVWPNSQ
jgi:hypothetical protein